MGKLKAREVFGYSIITVATCGTILLSSFISGYWTDVVGFSAGTVAAILMFSRVFDGFSDLIMGAIIDKTHTRFGKAKPWLVIGCIGLIFSTTIIFATPNISMIGKIIFAAIAYNLACSVFATMTGVAAPTLINLMTTDTNDRFKLGSRYFTIMFLVTTILGFGLDAVYAFGGGQQGYLKFAILCNIVAAIALVYTSCTVKERNEQKVEQKVERVKVKEFIATIFGNKYFLLVALIYFTTNIMAGAVGGSTFYYVIYILKNPTAFGILTAVSYGSLMAGTFVAPWLGNKIGVTKLVIIGNIIAAIVNTLIILRPADIVWTSVFMGLSCFANGPASAVLAPYNAMAADYGEYTTGVARPAVYSAGTSVGTKLGAGVGGAMAAMLLQFAGYNGALEVQTALVNNVIIFTYVLIPTIIYIAVAVLVIPFKKLENDNEMISAELARRHSGK